MSFRPFIHHSDGEILAMADAIPRNEASHGTEGVYVDSLFFEELCRRLRDVSTGMGRLQHAEIANQRLRAVLQWCGDGNCIHGSPAQRMGMHTNGGCRCKERVLFLRNRTDEEIASDKTISY